ncbi:MAG: hypothetical protein FWE41_03955 [Coriobacteriia bacterium]|nr:hypothetical protein [Coriobacteriia bacterium]
MRLRLLKATLTLGLCIVLTGALFAPLNAAVAAEEQSLQAVPSYVNPITGQIEDQGNNPGLGQGMVENLILKTPATLLIDAEGTVFITFRVGLVEESKDFRIELLDENGAVKKAVPYNIVAEQPDKNTQDLQISVPSVDSILRVSLVSIPMGREVVGFLQFAPEGEAVEIPVAEIDNEVNDEALSIYANTGNDGVTGVADEDRGPLLTFLGIAGAILFFIVGIAIIATLRKKQKSQQ